MPIRRHLKFFFLLQSFFGVISFNLVGWWIYGEFQNPQFNNIRINKQLNRKLNIADTFIFTERNKDGVPTCHYMDTKSKIFNAIKEEKYAPDVKTLTSAMLNCRDWQHDGAALEIFDLALHSSRVLSSSSAKKALCEEPDRVMYGIAIACAMTASADCSRAEELFSLCDGAFHLGKSTKHVEEDAAVFAAIIIACERLGQRDQLLRHFARMRALPAMRPSTGVVNSALRAACKKGDWPLFMDIKSGLAIFNRTASGWAQAPEEGSEEGPSWEQCSRALASARSGDEVGQAIFRLSRCCPESRSSRKQLVQQLAGLLPNPNLVDSAKLRRRIHRLMTSLEDSPVRAQDLQVAISPTAQLYGTLIESAGTRRDGPLALRYFRDAAAKLAAWPDRQLCRRLVEACSQDPAHGELLAQARQLLREAGEGLLPEASFFDASLLATVVVRNGPGPQSRATRQLVSAVKSRTGYRIDVGALPERGARMPSVAAAKDLLMLHCEKQALAACLQSSHQFPELISVNLSLCDDCHMFFKSASTAFNRRIKCQDPSMLHIFEGGRCSCNEFWGGR